ncbi:hypothetical protein HK096_005920, partial [Nowakowskiella sp. JEL0078]
MPRITEKVDTFKKKRSQSQNSPGSLQEQAGANVPARIATPSRLRESPTDQKSIIINPANQLANSVPTVYVTLARPKAKTISIPSEPYSQRKENTADIYSSSPVSTSSITSYGNASVASYSPRNGTTKSVPILVPVRPENNPSKKSSSMSLKSTSPGPNSLPKSNSQLISNSASHNSDYVCKICLNTLQPNETISIEAQANDRALRKIMDLEISNTSLLAVNNSLEATIRKQAQTIERLKSQIVT